MTNPHGPEPEMPVSDPIENDDEYDRNEQMGEKALRGAVAEILRDPQFKRAEPKHWLDVIAIVLSVIAIMCGAGAIWSQLKVGSDSSAQTLVHDQYELCRVLDQLRVEHPEISHMLALPRVASSGEPWSNYELVRRHVRGLLLDGQSAAVSPPDPTVDTGGTEGRSAPTAAEESARGRLYLQEHAVALHVFDIYEQTLYQRHLAATAAPNGQLASWLLVPVSDVQRLDVLTSLVAYYHEHMLRNPRLRYHWDHGGSDMMEADTRAMYDAHVRRAFADDYTDHASPLEAPEPQRTASP